MKHPLTLHILHAKTKTFIPNLKKFNILRILLGNVTTAVFNTDWFVRLIGFYILFHLEVIGLYQDSPATFKHYPETGAFQSSL